MSYLFKHFSAKQAVRFSMGVYIGLDIGGTKFMVASANKDGKILRRSRSAASASLQNDLDELNRMIEEVAGDEKIMGMGAAIGGPLDWEHGIVSPLHQPAWREVPLKQMMQDCWNSPFYVDVDTNIAALGEYYYGHISAERFLYLTISTGMGGGFLINGKIYRGANGFHPEIAHQSIPYHCANPARIQCECGAPDCLEALISGNGIRRIYQKPAEALTPAEWSEVAYNLGQGLRNIAAILAPECISLGGGVAVGGGEAFIEQARQVMTDHLNLVPAPILQLSSLGYDTALYGAIAVAIHGLGS
jgi:predicted NBD/HSP70 family sugar kinase